MPELPEVESIRGLLEKSVKDRVVISVKKSKLSLRKPLLKPLSHFKDVKTKGFSRWGKKLFIHFEDEGSEKIDLEVSLGMSGAFRFYSKKSKAQSYLHDHLTFNFDDDSKLIYNDPRRFGWVQSINNLDKSKFDSWDPLLGTDRQKELALRALKKSQRSLYSFLMDQTFITGLGNIYVQESLFRAGINPNQRGYKLSVKRADLLLNECSKILEESVKLGGCTLKDHKLLDGSSGRFQEKLVVYGKKKGEPCVKCGADLIHQKQPRTLTWCRKCQKS